MRACARAAEGGWVGPWVHLCVRTRARKGKYNACMQRELNGKEREIKRGGERARARERQRERQRDRDRDRESSYSMN